MSSSPLYTIALALTTTEGELPSWFAEAFEARKHLFAPRPFQHVGNSAGDKNKGKEVASAINVTERERKIATEAATRFNLDEAEAIPLIRSWTILQYGPKAYKDAQESTDDGWWDRFRDFYFDERLNALKVLADVVELSDESNTPNPMQEFCASQAEKLLPTAKDLLNAVVDLTKQTWPESARYSNSAMLSWAKQHLKEQQAILDLLFSILYSRSLADGSDIKALLECIKTTEWANKQATTAIWDADVRNLANSITCLLITLSIEAFGLEDLAADRQSISLSSASQRLPEKDNLLHPVLLNEVHKAILNLASSYNDLAAPLSFAWSIVLFKLADTCNDQEEPHPDYADFIKSIEPDESSAVFWQKLFTHAIDRMFSILSAVVGVISTRPNAAMLLAVLKSPIGIIPEIVKLSFLAQDNVDALTNYAVKVFSQSQSAGLRAQFWGLVQIGHAVPALIDGERQLLDLHSRRFPLQPAALLQLLRALSDGSSDSDAHNAQRACEYLRALPYLTCNVPSRASMAVPYEVSSQDPTLYTIVKPGGMQVAQGIVLPVDTHGRLVSTGPGESIVQWDLTADGWDGWQWLQSALESFAGRPRKDPKQKTARGNDPFLAIELPDMFEGRQDVLSEQVVADALDLRAKDLFSANPQAISLHGSGHENAAKPAQTALDILERAIATASLELTDAAIKFTTALLAVSPGTIWSLLRAEKGGLFVNSHRRSLKTKATLLSTARTTGVYKSIKSLVEFVYALILETQRSSPLPEHLQVKASVLNHALRWIYDEVWSAGYLSWKYANQTEKWYLCSTLIGLWTIVVSDQSLSGKGTLGGAGEEVTALLRENAALLGNHAQFAYETTLHASTSGKAVESAIVERALAAAYDLSRTLLSEDVHSTLANALVKSEGLALALVPSVVVFSAGDSGTCVAACQLLASIAVSTDAQKIGDAAILSLFSDVQSQIGALYILLADEAVPITIQIELWELLAVFVAFQPALAVVLVSGRLSPGEDADEQEKSAKLPQLAARQLKQSDEATPVRLISAILRALIGAWQQSVDLAAVIALFSDDKELWEVVIELATTPAAALSNLDQVKEHCEHVNVQTLAMRLLTLMIAGVEHQPEGKIWRAAMLGLLTSKPLMTRTTLSAAHSDANADLHQSMRSAFAAEAGFINLDAIGKRPLKNIPCLDLFREYGPSYQYATDVASAKLYAALSADDCDNLLALLEAVNCNWSLVDSQAILLDAWSTLLQQAFTSDWEGAATPAVHCILELSELAADERQAGDIVTTTHRERLRLLHYLTAPIKTTQSEELLVACWHQTQRLLDHATLSPVESIRHASGVHFHLELAEFISNLLDFSTSLQVKPLKEQASQVILSKAYDAVTRFAVALISHSATEDSDGVAIGISLFLRVIALPLAPKHFVWLGMLRDSGFWTVALASVARAGSTQNHHASDYLVFLLGISHNATAAEHIALEGTVQTLAASPLAQVAESGSIDCARKEDSNANLWCLTVSLVGRLAISLQNSSPFVEEVAGFVHLSLAQIQRAFNWQPATSPLSITMIEELPASVSLFAILCHRSPTYAACRLLTDDALLLTSALVYAVQHPNTLASALSAGDASQDAFMKESESKEASGDSIDFGSRPLAGALVQSMLGCLAQLIDSFNARFKSLDVLRLDMYQWPFEKTGVVLSSKSSSHDLATVGTLIELASYSVDVIRLHSPAAVAAGKRNTTPPALAPWSHEICRAYAAHILEGSLLLALTQMALAWHQPGSVSGGGSNSKAQRVIRNEIQPDIQSLIQKASGLDFRAPTLLAKANSRRGEPSKLLAALSRFAALYLQR